MKYIRLFFMPIYAGATIVALSPGFASLPFVRSAIAQQSSTQKSSAKEKVTTETNSTISNPDFISPFEREIIAELNLARTQPQKYAEYLSDYRKLYNGNRLLLPNRKPLITNEGLKAVDDALKFLNSASPLPGYDISNGMTLAARDRLFDMRKTGVLGHRGSDGSLPDQRLDRHGKWKSSVGEAIAYDVGTAREVVLGLIVDDGESNRGHRKSIFSSNYKIIGIAAGESLKPNENCVIDFAGAFVESAPNDSNKPKNAKTQKPVAGE